MSDVKWIKITTDIFDDEKILLIESLPDSYAIIVCWFKLLCMAGKQNNGGVFLLNDRIAYTDEMLATIFRMPVNTVRMSLDVFQKYGMVEVMDGVITIPNWNKHQSLDAYEKKKAYDREYRMKQRQKQMLIAEKSYDSRTTGRTMVGVPDKEEDKEKDIDIDSTAGTGKIDYEEIRKLYESICKSYPRCKVMSDRRKKAIHARFSSGYTVEDFRTVFEKAEASSFLKGRNKNSWSATLDWMIADANMAKILDGNYDDRGSGNVPKGASGNLGDEELDAIRQLMGEG